ncbi:hypothetical protein ACJX0J_024022, partial [Zea mays]
MTPLQAAVAGVQKKANVEFAWWGSKYSSESVVRSPRAWLARDHILRSTKIFLLKYFTQILYIIDEDEEIDDAQQEQMPSWHIQQSEPHTTVRYITSYYLSIHTTVHMNKYGKPVIIFGPALSWRGGGGGGGGWQEDNEMIVYILFEINFLNIINITHTNQSKYTILINLEDISDDHFHHFHQN